MSVALADLLVKLSDPDCLIEFSKDPVRVMHEAGLTEEDKLTLLIRKSAWIRQQASTDHNEIAQKAAQPRPGTTTRLVVVDCCFPVKVYRRHVDKAQVLAPNAFGSLARTENCPRRGPC